VDCHSKFVQIYIICAETIVLKKLKLTLYRKFSKLVDYGIVNDRIRQDNLRSGIQENYD